MTELELTAKLDQALLVSEEHATKVTNEILRGADTMTYLAFAKYCRNFLTDTDKYDVTDATPDVRRSLAASYTSLIQVLELLISLNPDEVSRFNSILGDLKIDL